MLIKYFKYCLIKDSIIDVFKYIFHEYEYIENIN